MIDYSNASFTPTQAKEILSLTLIQENLPDNITLPDRDPLSMQDILDSLIKTGLNRKNVETAANAYFQDQVIRRSVLTKTKITEERVLESEAEKNTIWQHLISELTYRMGEKPVIQTVNSDEREWVFSDRSGNETTIKLHKTGKKVKLELSQKISYFGPKKESLGAGFTISFITVGYLYLFLQTAFLTNLIILFIMMGLLPVLIRKILTGIRKKKIIRFERLTDQITEHIPRFEQSANQPIDPNSGSKSASQDSELFSIRKSFSKRNTRF